MTYNPDEQRDAKGKWTAGGGTEGFPPLQLPPFDGVGSVEYVRERANKIAADMGFDPTRIDISEERPTFELNGQKYNTGGIAETQKPEGEGRVVLYRQNIKADQIDGVIVHEIEHMKFQSVINRYIEESSAVSKVPDPAPIPDGEHFWQRRGGSFAVMASTGELRSPFKEQFKTYSALHDALYKYDISKDFAKTDGVSPYSYEWWKAWQNGTVSTAAALHETLAEMARAKVTTGKFPDHMGPRIIEYRALSNRATINNPDFDGDVPKMSKKEIAEGTKRWRELYRTVEELTK